MVFDRPAGSERDLVLIAATLDATIVQRHPSGAVRVVGSSGVFRWEGFDWHHEPPVRSWSDAVLRRATGADPLVLEALLEFAVHDLGARNVGALLVYRERDKPAGVVEKRLPTPPPLRITQPAHLAPIRHALAQVDGAAVFAVDGTLRQLGARLVPSTDAEAEVAPLKGTRHTSGRRYSYDEPDAVVIAVSEDGPVSVLRRGEVLGHSAEEDD
jgi:DNA integrity scanning protein DisA with diadenylate cyclase activity